MGRVLSCTIACVIFSSAIALAQQNVPASDQRPVVTAGRDPSPGKQSTKPGSAADVIEQAIVGDSMAAARQTPPLAVPFLSSSTESLYVAAMDAYYRKKVADYGYTTDVYNWQMFSSRVIFFFVMMLVAAGLWFSWLQFRFDMRSRDRAVAATVQRSTAQGAIAAAPAPEAPAEKTEIKFGTQGFEVSSSVLGVIILAISLAFLYLYLVYVYPISEVK